MDVLTSILAGVNTVLSFIVAHADPGGVAQKTLIDASVAAGVKRFAPSEWGSSKIEELPWYAEKATIRAYLQEINKEKKVLEYTLFQPGFIVDYLAPVGTSKHLQPMPLWLDFHKRRAIVLEGKDSFFTLTTVNDLANVVVRAIEYDGEWPVVGGVKGTTLGQSKILEIGEKARGPFDITTVKEEDLRADNLQVSWLPMFVDPHLSPEQNDYFSKLVLKGTLLSARVGSWVVSDEWNRLLPDYRFTDPEQFLLEHWAGKA